MMKKVYTANLQLCVGILNTHVRRDLLEELIDKTRTRSF